MPFVKVPGLKGKVYVPEESPEAPKKNPCPDCFSCQMCADSRCHVCLRDKGGKDACLCLEKHPSENPDIADDKPPRSDEGDLG